MTNGTNSFCHIRGSEFITSQNNLLRSYNPLGERDSFKIWRLELEDRSNESNRIYCTTCKFNYSSKNHAPGPSAAQWNRRHIPADGPNPKYVSVGDHFKHTTNVLAILKILIVKYVVIKIATSESGTRRGS